jgi:hypothetical protein
MDYVAAGATISMCGKYRYRLWREWRSPDTPRQHWRWLQRDYGYAKSVVFVMLNPSTADGERDDPTIRRCVNFAKRFRYDRLDVINLFAYRATDPKALLALNDVDDPVGPDNLDAFADTLMSAGVVIAAWGTHGRHLGQDETALGWIEQYAHVTPYCLGSLTRKGCPRHPLYVRNDAARWPFGEVL